MTDHWFVTRQLFSNSRFGKTSFQRKVSGCTVRSQSTRQQCDYRAGQTKRETQVTVQQARGTRVRCHQGLFNLSLWSTSGVRLVPTLQCLCETSQARVEQRAVQRTENICCVSRSTVLSCGTTCRTPRSEPHHLIVTTRPQFLRRGFAKSLTSTRLARIF